MIEYCQGMLPVDIHQATLADVENLLANKVPEGLRLDYKRDTVGKQDKDVVEFLKDVTSFANAAGGDIVFGVAESKGVPASIEGLPDVTDVDAEILRLNQMILTGIEPPWESSFMQSSGYGPGQSFLRACHAAGQVCTWYRAAEPSAFLAEPTQESTLSTCIRSGPAFFQGSRLASEPGDSAMSA